MNLINAIINNDFQKTHKFLIEEGRSAATTLFDDLTPLHFAAVYGSKKA